MKNLLSYRVKGQTILLLFFVTTAVYLIMLLVTIPKLMMFSEGKKIMDMMPGGYDSAYVSGLMQALGEEGRAYYITRQLPLDFLYPGLFAVTYSLIFIFFLRLINKHDTRWRFIAFLPVIAGAADYIENLCTISIIKKFPDVSASLVNVSSMVSVLKASATTIFFISLLILLVVVVVNRWRHRRPKDQSK